MRKIVIRQYRPPRSIPQETLQQGDKLRKRGTTVASDKRFFAWAKVLDRHSEDMTVDLRLDTGLDLRRVAVRSLEWAGSSGSTGYGERDLPPKDALVLVVFPYGTDEEALVLCSSFTPFGKHATAWKSELMASNKEEEKLTVGESGTKITTNKSNGDTTVELKSGAKLTITVNDATVEITAAGAVNITPKTGQKIKLNNGTIGANDYPNCLFSGAPHCNDTAASVGVP